MADRRGGVALLTDPTVASLLKTGTRGPGESPSPEEFGWASPAAHLALVRACFLLLLQRRGLFGERSSEQAWGHVFGDAPSLQDEDLLAALALLPESALPGTVDDLAGLHQVLLADQLVPVGFVSDEETATPVGNRRRQQGAFYTPPPLAAWLVEQCLAAQVLDRRPEALLVCDPACGGGVILTAALRFLRGAAEPQTDPRVLASNLHGVDIDPVAAELTRMAIWLELGDETLSLVQAAPNVGWVIRFCTLRWTWTSMDAVLRRTGCPGGVSPWMPHRCTGHWSSPTRPSVALTPVSATRPSWPGHVATQPGRRRAGESCATTDIRSVPSPIPARSSPHSAGDSSAMVEPSDS